MTSVVVGGLAQRNTPKARTVVVHVLASGGQPACGARIGGIARRTMRAIEANRWRRAVTCRRCLKRRAP